MTKTRTVRPKLYTHSFDNPRKNSRLGLEKIVSLEFRFDGFPLESLVIITKREGDKLEINKKCYRPQRSCGKVVFLHLSVSDSVHKGGGCLYPSMQHRSHDQGVSVQGALCPWRGYLSRGSLCRGSLSRVCLCQGDPTTETPPIQ